MRDKDKKFLMLAMIALLVVAGVGTWFILRDDGTDGKVAKANTLDDNSDVFGDDGDPLALDNTGRNPSGDGGSRDGGTSDGGTTDGGTADGGTNHNPDNPGPGPGPDNPNPDQPVPTPKNEWEAETYEVVIFGRVSIKSDGRAAVGAKVTAEISTETNAWAGWRGESDGAVPMVSGTDSDKPKGGVEGSTTTDGLGEYRMTLKVTSHRLKKVDGVEQGRMYGALGLMEQVVVVATLSGYAPARSRTLWLYQDTSEEEEVNLKLAVPSAVRGRVVDAVDRKGIAGATGSFSDVESWSDGGSTPISFTSDADGYFSVNPIPAGTYSLDVQAAGYAGYNGWRGMGRINLAGGEEKDIGEVLMMKAASVSGRVITEQDGKPIAGATVSLRQPTEWGAFDSHSVQTVEDGTFIIQAIDPGTYTIKFRATGYAGAELTAQAVEPGQELKVGDIKLGKGLVLSGVVTGADNKPVAGAKVRLLEPPGTNTWYQEGTEVASADTDAEGRFELAGVSNGTFKLKAASAGYAAYTEELKVSGQRSDLDVRLQRGGTVVGRVADAGGTAAPDCVVRVINQNSQGYSWFKTQPSMAWGMMFGDDENSGSSDADGKFRIENVPAGVYLVIAILEGESPAFKDDVTVENDREVGVGELRFKGKGSARITVTEDGVPVPELSVSLGDGTAWGGMGGHEGTTGNSGEALIENIPAGTWYIRTGRDEATFDTDLSRRRIVIELGRVTEFTLELRPKDGVHLHGTLTVNGKAIFNDIMLLGLGDRSDVIKTAKPQEGGFYEFVGLKTGSYVLHARESDTVITCKAVLDLKEEGEFPFNCDFKCVPVSGTVSTPENTPAQLSSVSVSITHQMNEHPDFTAWLKGRVDAGSDGKFKFDNVPPGKYTLSAALDGVGNANTQITVGAEGLSGLSIAIAQNSGSIKLVVTKLNGTPVSGGAFGTVGLNNPDGTPVDLGEFQGWFMLSQGAAQTIPTIEPGTYTVVVKASGYLQALVAGVVVKKGEVTNADVELTAAAELHLTLTNSEVTQPMLDTAVVRYFDAGGAEVPREVNAFDSWGAPAPQPGKPTLFARYLSAQVTEVRVKVAGYAELVVPVQFAVGKKIEFEGTLVAE